MEADPLLLPVFVQLPYGAMRQVGSIEAGVGHDIEASITEVINRLRE